MSQADCGVFPSKAEGWGLESAEMLAMGKHVIITDYSSHTEYANADNSRLIYVDNLEPANDGIWFNADSEEWDGKPGEWAALGKSQEEQLITHLRDIHRLRSNGILGQNTKGLEIGNLFSWNNTAKEILDGLRNS
jgi:glycosyltransferase involved in cell wall biosynthesis